MNGQLHDNTDKAVLLRAVGMTKTFGNKVAVQNVDLTLRAGEIHALLGENGAGKSTLISMLSGQYRPDAGSLETRQQTIRLTGPKDSLRHGIGVVYQDFRLVEDFSVLDNLVLGTGTGPTRAAWQKAENIMGPLGFDLGRDNRVSRLTVGEKQQLEILKMLYRGADVLILDEPTAVLTPQQSVGLFAALRVLTEQGKAVMFVSHKLREVSEVADRISVLRGGRLVASRLSEKADARALAHLMMGEDVGQERSVGSGAAQGVVMSLSRVSTEPGRRSSLRDINISVSRGEIVGVAGVSGNGQTDLAEVASQTRAPTSGKVTFEGDSIGYVPEDRLAAGLVGSMTIAENLALRTYHDRGRFGRWFVSRRRMAEHARPLIESFGVPAAPTVRASELSGGGQQRTILARELSSDPDLMVVCQPTRGLDVVSARTIHDHLIRVRDSGCGVLLVSEDLDEVLRLSDRVLVMVKGVVKAELAGAVATRANVGSHMTDSQDEHAFLSPEETAVAASPNMRATS